MSRHDDPFSFCCCAAALVPGIERVSGLPAPPSLALRWILYGGGLMTITTSHHRTPTVRSSVKRLLSWPGKPWCTSTSFTTHKGILCCSWSLWRTQAAAMDAAYRATAWNVHLERKDIARTEAMERFEQDFRAVTR